MGFTAYNHHTRMGADTVSWYRGPLTPYAPQKGINVPVFSSDALLRFNPDTGMFDVSYAAAWQIGQYLGLQSKAYSAALYNWKKQVSKAAVEAYEKSVLPEQQHDFYKTFFPDDEDPADAIARNIILPALDKLNSGT